MRAVERPSVASLAFDEMATVNRSDFSSFLAGPLCDLFDEKEKSDVLTVPPVETFLVVFVAVYFSVDTGILKVV